MLIGHVIECESKGFTSPWRDMIWISLNFCMNLVCVLFQFQLK